MSDHVGESCNDLLLRGQVGTFLELEIANSTGQSQIAIDSAEVDEASSCTDSCLLAYRRG
jgi:hypothetical protein